MPHDNDAPPNLEQMVRAYAKGVRERCVPDIVLHLKPTEN